MRIRFLWNQGTEPGDVVYFIHFCLPLSWGLNLFLGHFSTKTSLKSFFPFGDNPRIGIAGRMENSRVRQIGHWVTWVYRVHCVHWVIGLLVQFSIADCRIKGAFVVDFFHLCYFLPGNILMRIRESSTTEKWPNQSVRLARVARTFWTTL